MNLENITQARYIKLGRGGKWEQLCLSEGTLRLNYYEVPYELGLQGDKKALCNLFSDLGFTPSKASDHARQVIDFYHCEAETLWVTFSGGYLWWARCESPVEYNGKGTDQEVPGGSHIRKTVDGWHNTSLSGTKLGMSDLSGRLTRVAAYRQTICAIKDQASDYLLRKLHDQDLPEITDVKQSRTGMLKSTKKLIKLLTWQDFELFVELIFSQSGWRRISSIGGKQKTLDLELILPTTGERAIIQVKSKTDQTQLNDYIERFKGMNADKYFYIYHSAKGNLDAGDSDVFLIDANHLTELSFKAGLIDWLIEKVS